MHHKLLFSIATMAISFQALSETTLQDTLQEIVVTGTPTKINKNYIPLSVSVVSRRQIEESGESSLLPVLNGRVPGLFVTERGITGFGVSAGAAGQITMRGVGGSPTTGVLMLIDGHPQFMGIFGHPLADAYISSDVEKVEIIRGPGSILYGTNAMGGVINIITRKQSADGFHGNARVMYGSFNTQKYSVNSGVMKDKLNLFASVNHDSTDGHRANSEFRITNGYIKAGYELSKHFTSSTDFSLASFQTTDPGPDTLGAIKGNTIDIQRGYWSFSIDNDFNKFAGSAKAFYNFGTHNLSDGFHSNDNNLGLNISETVKLFKGNSLSIGSEVISYGGKATSTKLDGTIIQLVDTAVMEAGIYGLVQQTLFDNLTLNAGIRLQNHSTYGTEWIPSFGLAYRLSPATTLKTSAGKGFRSPAIRELFLFNHNPNLEPERINSYELSVLQSFHDGKLSLELTGFMLNGDNLIVTDNMGRLYNGGTVNNKGLELSAVCQPASNFTANLTYSYINMERPVYATPRNHFFLSASYLTGKFSLSASLRHVEHLNTVAIPQAIPNFQNFILLSAKITFQATKGLSVFASGNNLLNQTYETNRYYTMPGLTVFGGVNYRF